VTRLSASPPYTTEAIASTIPFVANIARSLSASSISLHLLIHTPREPGGLRGIPCFFAFAKATGGALLFDLNLYRDLDPATRRLYLFLRKIFWRTDVSADIDLRHIAVDLLGFASTIETCHLKRKLGTCIEQLVDRAILRLPAGVMTTSQLITKQTAGIYHVRFFRGDHLNAPVSTPQTSLTDSPLYAPLHTIGFDETTILRIIRRYRPHLIHQWADITLAAIEHRGRHFFTNSPQAYFVDNIKAAAARRRTPPDWWRALRKRELHLQAQQEQSEDQSFADSEAAFEEYLTGEARHTFIRITDHLVHELRHAGQSEPEARSNAKYMARMHLRNSFQHARS